MRVVDDGGAGGLRVELPLFRDPRSLRPWGRTDGEGEGEMFYLGTSRMRAYEDDSEGVFFAFPRHSIKNI